MWTDIEEEEVMRKKEDIEEKKEEDQEKDTEQKEGLTTASTARAAT